MGGSQRASLGDLEREKSLAFAELEPRIVQAVTLTRDM
jgi:hypothetical protein